MKKRKTEINRYICIFKVESRVSRVERAMRGGIAALKLGIRNEELGIGHADERKLNVES